MTVKEMLERIHGLAVQVDVSTGDLFADEETERQLKPVGDVKNAVTNIRNYVSKIRGLTNESVTSRITGDTDVLITDLHGDVGAGG